MASSWLFTGARPMSHKAHLSNMKIWTVKQRRGGGGLKVSWHCYYNIKLWYAFCSWQNTQQVIEFNSLSWVFTLVLLINFILMTWSLTICKSLNACANINFSSQGLVIHEMHFFHFFKKIMDIVNNKMRFNLNYPISN